MDDKPKLKDAPGYVLRQRRDGWSVLWQCRTDVYMRGYKPRKVRIAVIGNYPTEGERKFISDTCQSFQDDMLAFARDLPAADHSQYDGTIGGLIAAYLTDPDSPFRKKRYASRKSYEAFMRRIKEDHGSVIIKEITARSVLRWHEEWMKRGVTMAHQTITILRLILKFGSTLLNDPACREARLLLSEMTFPVAEPRNTTMTVQQANAIRRALHAKSLHSAALAQSMQFEFMLRQKDVIGEYVPQDEPGISAVIFGQMKWMRGLVWEEVNENFILTHVTSKRQKSITIDMKLAPMVVEELNALYPGIITKNEITLAPQVNRSLAPASGPIIVCEYTGRPWSANSYRIAWRKAATASGVPKEVYNMDNRASGVSEASDAGADMEKIRHAATHSNISTTQRYSRNSAEKTAEVMRMRVEHRNKDETK